MTSCLLPRITKSLQNGKGKKLSPMGEAEFKV